MSICNGLPTSVRSKLLTIALFCLATHLSVAKAGNPAATHYIDNSVNDPEVLEAVFSSPSALPDSAYHLLTHGRPGELLIEGRWMRPPQIAEWLVNQGIEGVHHLYIYGCEFAKGKKGEEALVYLESRLGVRCAASANITGAAGDWQLEAGDYDPGSRFSEYAHSLQDISGQINSYAKVTAINEKELTVSTIEGFHAGDKVLVIQMQGAVIDDSNTPSYGNIHTYGPVGNYDFDYVATVSNSKITLHNGLTKIFHVSDNVQIIKVPVYAGITTVTGNITGAQWNGRIGGVIALEADSLVLRANIDISERGFRGGTISKTSQNTKEYVSTLGAQKGEGSAKFTKGDRLQGSQGNGGGGGNWVNDGGGGGSNFGSGGIAGSYDGKSPYNGGKLIDCDQFPIQMGGGGGAGDANDGGNGPGANGGGLVFIIAKSIDGDSDKGYKIMANGGSAPKSSASDGSGGGGGGGAVVFPEQTVIASAVTVEVKGGNGGEAAAGHAAGGGGGGGAFFSSYNVFPDQLKVDFSGGKRGSGGGATPTPGGEGKVFHLTEGFFILPGQSFTVNAGDPVGTILKDTYDPSNLEIKTILPADSFRLFSLEYDHILRINGNGQLSILSPLIVPGIYFFNVVGYYNGQPSCPEVIEYRIADKDTDNDGVLNDLDIDDDNDGILDAIESPACFHTTADVAIVAVTSTLQYTENASYRFSELYDGSVAKQGAYGISGTAVAGQSMYDIEMAFFVELDSVEVIFSYSIFQATAKFKWQGFDGISWVDVTDELTEKQANNSSYTYRFKPTGKLYFRYRLLGISGNSHTNQVKEIIPYANIQSSKYPKIDCLADNDKAGTLNHLDLDSDGDGCHDAYEAGVPGATKDTGTVVASTDKVGANGYKDALETIPDSGVPNFADDYYKAILREIQACADSDNDGISDAEDIDDDNDGIPDETEVLNHCQYLGGIDLRQLSYAGSSNLAVTTGEESISIVKTEGPWSSVYSKQTFALPLYMEFTVQSEASAGMIGLIPADAVQIPENSNDSGYKFHFVNETSFDVRSKGAVLVPNGNYAKGNKFSIDIDAAGTLVMSKNGAVIYTTTKLPIIAYEIVLSSGSAEARTFSRIVVNTKPLLHFYCTDIDTDGDKLPNRLDLDSDGDGCSDMFEAGVTGSIKNGSSSFPTTGVGSNGLWDALETTADAGVVNYISKYLYANSTIYNLCTDTDNDGVGDLTDIDDDNDGVVDETEMTCEIAEVPKGDVKVTIPDGITYTNNGNYRLANLVDEIDKNIYVVSAPRPSSPGQSINNYPWLIVSFDTEKILTYWEIGHYNGQILFRPGSTYRIEGSNDNVSWIDLSGELKYHNIVTSTSNGLSTYNSNIATFPDNTGAFIYYRIFGISGAAGSGWATEMYFKEKICSDLDTDGDKTFNRQDLDSDGDGCGDKQEAGVPGTASNGADGDKSIQGEVGINGLANTLEIGSDNGHINYTSTYIPFAITARYNGCADTDADGVNDLTDIDDDNDGILDHTEQICSNATTLYPDDLPLPKDSPNERSNSFTNGNYNTLNKPGINSGSSWSAPEISSAPGTYYVGLVFPKPSSIATLSIRGRANDRQWVTKFRLEATRDKIASSSQGSSAAWTVIGTFTGNSDQNTIVNHHVNSLEDWLAVRIVPLEWSAFPSLRFSVTTCSVTDPDSDNDGIPNRMELDSDSDGCSDAQEAGVFDLYGAAFASNGVLNKNVEVGTNGFADILQDIASENTYRNTYTYRYATNSTQNTCLDSDGDKIKDLIDPDDDNDKVIDVIEMLGKSMEIPKSEISVSLPANIKYQLNTGENRVLNNIIDGIDGDKYVIVNPSPSGGATTLNNSPWLTISFSTEKVLTYWEIGHLSGQQLFSNTSKYKIRGSNDNVNWTDITSELMYRSEPVSINEGLASGSSNIASFPFNNQAFIHYQIYGREGASGGGWATEMYLKEKVYADLDTDGDKIPNRLDTDSDNDGCSDMGESGSGDYYGYAILANYNGCTDSDIDGVSDLIDIDDDNDGVLDKLEQIPANKNATVVPDKILPVLSREKSNSFSNGNYNLTIVEPGLNSSIAWAPPTAATGYYLGVIFSKPTGVASVSIQGRATSSPNNPQWVIRYRLEGTKETIEPGSQGSNVAWISLGEYKGNTDQTSTVTSAIHNPDDNWKAVRIVPLEWNGFPSLRFAVTTLITADIDTDNDGTPNRLDNDSDGDRCSDRLESGAPEKTGASEIVGANGLPDALEKLPDNAVTNFKLTYREYALQPSLNFCADTDSDGVKDIFDRDDDNDGILNNEEIGCGSFFRPFTNLAQAAGAPSGRYYFNLGSGLFLADVDDAHDGGWVLVLQYVHKTGTDPGLNILKAGANFPITSNAAIGTDGSGDLARWGHVGNNALSKFEGDIEIRFYAESSLHSRKMHFRTTEGNTYIKTGSGSFANLKNNFDPLPGHSSFLPGKMNNYYSNLGDLALTTFPFFTTQNYHWGINHGLRWEVDDIDTSKDLPGSTIHKVWIRAVNRKITPPCKEADTDKDKVVDRLDKDSDSDGIVDAREAQPSIGFIAPTGNDADNDGIDNAYDIDSGGKQLILVDTDGDNIPDYLDSDSDNDGSPDWKEGFDDDGDGNALNDIVERVKIFFKAKVPASLAKAARSAIVPLASTSEVDRWLGDDDNDTVLNFLEDDDNDGLPNFRDSDSEYYKDNDRDGKIDLDDREFLGRPSDLPDSDRNGIPDFRDQATLVILPVKLVRFDATIKGNRVFLTWATATEINSERFEAYRSKDGQNWEYVGTVEAAGSSQSERTYQLTDEHLQEDGIWYYRLTSIDFDGTSENSSVRRVVIGEFSNTIVNVWPNPNDGNFNVSVTGQGEVTTLLTLTSISGLLVWEGKLTGQLSTLSVNRLLPGAYLLRVMTPTETKQIKVIVE